MSLLAGVPASRLLLVPQFVPDLVGTSDHGWSGSVFRSLVRTSVNWVRQLLWTRGAIDPPS